MGKIKKISVVALVLLLVGVVGSLLTFKPAFQSNTVSKKQMINGEFNHIDISSADVRVDMIPTTDSNAKVTLSGRVGKASTDKLVTNVQNSTLIIGVKLEQRNLINFIPSTLALKVYVPEKLYDSLKIVGSDGRIALSEFQAKTINVKTSDGSIELTNVKGTTITTESQDGSSLLKNVMASTIKVNSQDGRINLANIDGKILGQSQDGSITFVTKHLDHPINFKTRDGSIKIETKEKPTNAIINSNVRDGRVNIFGSDKGTVFGNGEYKINLTSVDGRITVEKK